MEKFKNIIENILEVIRLLIIFSLFVISLVSIAFIAIFLAINIIAAVFGLISIFISII